MHIQYEMPCIPPIESTDNLWYIMGCPASHQATAQSSIKEWWRELLWASSATYINNTDTMWHAKVRDEP